MWCHNCTKNISRTERYQGKIICPLCGTVLDEDNFTEEPSFVKNAAGQSQLSGTIVRSVLNKSGISEKTYNDASDGIQDLMYALGINGGDSLTKPALRLFTLLVERNFTKGRRKELVQASCLYIICRIQLKPYLLIDFSEHLGINVYVLGTVFLQICKALSLVEHEFVQKPVDPSLFIHRFADRLCQGQHHKISMTALRIIASMKRDWMQTGRKPSGLCGAALYISSLSNGFKCSKSDIIKVVHVCEATLTKRLIEFENTESGGLTIEEFNIKSKELEKEEGEERNQTLPKTFGKNNEFLCKHNDSGETPFAHGLCKDCYDDFIKISGGLGGGLEPPAFQRAERKRIMAEEAANDRSENSEEHGSSNEHRSTKNMTEGACATSQNKDVDDSIDEGTHPDPPLQDSETLSDVDDSEVDVYLHTEEEKHLKKIVWEEMNKEYLEEQAIKEAEEKAAREAYEAKIANCSEEEKAKLEQEFAAAKSKKEKQRKRAAELKAAGPPQTAAEATKRVLDKKRLSSKVRYDVLKELFEDGPENPDSNKKMRTETGHEDNYLDKNGKDDPEFEDNEDNYLNNIGEYDPEFEGAEDPYSNNVDEYDYNDDYSNIDDY